MTRTVTAWQKTGVQWHDGSRHKPRSWYEYEGGSDMTKSNGAIAREIVERRHPDQQVYQPRFSPFGGGFYTVATSGGQELVSLGTIRQWREKNAGA